MCSGTNSFSSFLGFWFVGFGGVVLFCGLFFCGLVCFFLPNCNALIVHILLESSCTTSSIYGRCF